MYQGLAAKAYDRIRQMIISGELKPGQKLIQENLAAELGVSRTPLLQAISRLSKDNLVVCIPRRGAYVRTLDEKTIIDVFDVRCALEPMGAALAASNITDKELEDLRKVISEMEEAVSSNDSNAYIELDLAFHAKIMKSSRNQYIYDIIKGFSTTMLTRDMLLKSIEESLWEHKTIFNSLSRREAIAAKTAMEYHLNDNSRVKLRELLKSEAKVSIEG